MLKVVAILFVSAAALFGALVVIARFADRSVVPGERSALALAHRVLDGQETVVRRTRLPDGGWLLRVGFIVTVGLDDDTRVTRDAVVVCMDGTRAREAVRFSLSRYDGACAGARAVVRAGGRTVDPAALRRARG